MKNKDFSKFMNIGFEDFKAMATDRELSCYEAIGFPNEYRAGYEEKIFSDITTKLSLLNCKHKNILDIGPGCSDLPEMLIDLCQSQEHILYLIDSEEMLSKLQDKPFIKKIPARYPIDCQSFICDHSNKIDVILTYSVFHYIFVEGNIYDFLDQSLSMLADGGQMLIGDIPNISKRKRFFNSRNGIQFHQNFTGTQEVPIIEYNKLENGNIDDGVLFGVLTRCRMSGFDAYLVPQPSDLPMANRREDILISKP